MAVALANGGDLNKKEVFFRQVGAWRQTAILVVSPGWSGSKRLAQPQGRSLEAKF